MELFDRVVSLVHFLLLFYIEKSELVTWKQKLNTVIMSMAIKWQFYKNKFAWNFAGLSGEYREYHVIFLKVLGEHITTQALVLINVSILSTLISVY